MTDRNSYVGRLYKKFNIKIILILFVFTSSCNGGVTTTKNYTSQVSDTVALCENKGETYVSDSTYFADLELDSLSYHLKGGYTLLMYPINNKRDFKIRLIGNGIDAFLYPCDSCSWSTYTPKFIPIFKGIDFDGYFVVERGMYWYLYKKDTGQLMFEAVSSSTYDTKNNLLFYSSQEEGENYILLNLKTFKKANVDDCIAPKDRDNPYFGSMNARNLFKITKVTQQYVELQFTTEDKKKPIRIKIERTKFNH